MFENMRPEPLIELLMLPFDEKIIVQRPQSRTESVRIDELP